jgi:3-oxoacyl-[acyl-carrier protein] reductase
MNLDLHGKTALVCGSTQGIGRAVATELSGMGAKIVLLARNEEKLKDVSKALGNGCEYLVADFSKPEEVKKVVSDYVASNPIHILINNTGGPPGGPIADAKEEEFYSAFTNHLINNHNLVTAVKQSMIDGGYGRIINVISTSVKIPLTGLGVSNTIRGAVANWSKTLANELGIHQITVNNVLPGATETERLTSIISNKASKSGATEETVAAKMAGAVPMNRFAKPEEVANAIAFLASPAAAYINGINVPVDGGRTGSL